MKKLSYLFMFIISMCFIMSCSEEQISAPDNSKSIIGNDTILIIPDDVEYIATEEYLIAKLQKKGSNNFTDELWENSLETRANDGSTTHVLYGYSSINYSTTGKVAFGDFIKKYGLVPQVIYIRRFATCIKNFPCAPNDAIVERQYADLGIPMGFIPGALINNNYITGYKVGTYNPQGFRSAESFVFQIVSDLSGRQYDVYYPYRPEEIVWYYKTISTDEW